MLLYARKKTGKSGRCALVPADAKSEELMASIKDDVWVTVDVREPRNPKFHRLYFGLLHTILPHQDRYKTIDELHAALKVEAGIRTQIRLSSGAIAYIPGSIAFDVMDEKAFEEFFGHVCDFVAADIIPGIDQDDLRLNIESMIGMREAAE